MNNSDRMDNDHYDDRTRSSVGNASGWMMDPGRWSDPTGHAFLCPRHDDRNGERACTCGGGEWVVARKSRPRPWSRIELRERVMDNMELDPLPDRHPAAIAAVDQALAAVEGPFAVDDLLAVLDHVAMTWQEAQAEIDRREASGELVRVWDEGVLKWVQTATLDRLVAYASRNGEGAPAMTLEASTNGRPAPPEPDEPPRPSRLRSAAERRLRPEPVWRVEHVLAEWGVGQVFGDTYTGKTFVVLDLALRMCNGLGEWFGFAIRQPGPVVFVLMEGAFDFQQRIDAWLAAHPGCTDADLYTLEEEEVDLRDPASVARIAQDVEALGLDPALVVIDTQGLATPGTDENSNTEMNEVYANGKRLARGLGAFVLTVHHTGHSDKDRSRGASAQRAALDAEVRVRDGLVAVTKVKAWKPSGPYGFALRPSGASVYVEPVPLAVAASKRVEDARGDVNVRHAIVRALKDLGSDVPKGRLFEAVGGNRGDFDLALDAMVEDGSVDRRLGSRNARLHTLAEPEPDQ